ncbi:MAG: OB-fold nucleic acid binding domain-containing protein [Candidatus Nanoarchaeia archaeon]|nr:OB-fold nucleic acid binding domain-containing protein [Candidatus Nanoarchaeia archaeon]MDD5054499.1 OB-fold nucleic acid binding domain-containing protein [Candidatus Nanoarchaeia archaeon]MDD5499395.1 OB-fold nucleic acid binding domain-containing protein [Candidatus Nanoarchaeia archaeon]
MEYEQIISKIIKEKGVSKEILESKIKDKILELDNLISQEGAANIIAGELGVDINESDLSQESVEIKKLLPIMKNVSIAGKVTDIYPISSFQREGKEQEVGALSLNDGTGFARVVFWNDSISLFKNIKQGDCIKIINAYIKENKFGKIEVHISFRSKVRINPEEEDFSSIKISANKVPCEKIDLAEIKKDSDIKVFGIIVQLFKKNCFFTVCPECKKSAKAEDGIFMCKEHGRIIPEKKMFISYVLDDGTSNIRCTSFGFDAEKILGISTKQAVEIADKHEDNSYPIEHSMNTVIGKEVIIYGKTQFNDFSNSIEIVSNKIIDKIDYSSELKEIYEESKYGDKN